MPGANCISVSAKPFPFSQPINNADFIVPVEIDGTIHQVYVLKRPYVDEFLQKMGELYECVLFTASLAKVSVTTRLLSHEPALSSYSIRRFEEKALLVTRLTRK